VTPEEQAARDAAEAKAIRELASQITQMSKLGFDPLTIRKGIIGAVSDTSTPPTVSVNISGDTETLVNGVRLVNNFTPIIGQTVLIGKQGTELFVLGAISSSNPVLHTVYTDNGWVKATLANGFHNGNSSGDIYYRRVLDHGSWKMQWQGGWDPNGATTMITALDPDYRPASRRPIICARNASGAVSVKMDFQTDGSVTMVGGTTGTTGTSHSTASAGFHQHEENGGGDFTFFAGTHDHSIGSHSHSVDLPTWVSLNGVEYFL
jgi:hypothetical protein